MDRLKDFTDRSRPRRAVVIGAGFIGMEVEENLHDRGIQVSIVELADQVRAPLDFEMAAQSHDHLKMKRVEFYLSIGVKPEITLAEKAGIKTGRGILVNEYMETSQPGIYALGDAAEFTWPVTGKTGITPLAGPAGKQARILADNLVYGKKKAYPGAISTAIAKIFDMTVASTGVAQKILEKEGVASVSVITHGHSHAGYYTGVDKRIEMIAAVLRRRPALIPGGTDSQTEKRDRQDPSGTAASKSSPARCPWT